MENREDLIEWLLHLGDSALIQGQRLCEWCGHAPALEEELALMNVGLDLVGQARNWYAYVADLSAEELTPDDLAFRRDERAFRNLLLVEQPNGDYGVTMAKQFFYDAWHHTVLAALSDSQDARIAGIAAKALKEVTYHLTRSGEWMVRLGDGTEESHRRMLAAVDQLWRFTFELTEATPTELRLAEAGVVGDPARRAAAWQAQVERVMAQATLPLPAPAVPNFLSGQRGLHSEHLGPLLAQMQYLQRAYPDATW
ncbi:1,2-phenylacetyl-CoA epoxidase subunit PaaC [Pseudomonas massiliensis]|uniref:1,2-phenylacetyl-CoA epoxidase subunit PaaC n=1 Tax=Pseudomonas massiliensis TaxID=522492 RepID=UPI00058F721D|nr:1,2-phenylacetyl-CoA epoxidase subunit PaaC [Pseudomonas massiliensis]